MDAKWRSWKDDRPRHCRWDPKEIWQYPFRLWNPLWRKPFWDYPFFLLYTNSMAISRPIDTANVPLCSCTLRVVFPQQVFFLPFFFLPTFFLISTLSRTHLVMLQLQFPAAGHWTKFFLVLSTAVRRPAGIHGRGVGQHGGNSCSQPGGEQLLTWQGRGPKKFVRGG